MNLRLAIVRWVDAAVDLEVEALSKRGTPTTAGLIAEGRLYLIRVRADLIGLLRLYTP